MARPRPWTLEGLMAARVLAAANAPLTAIAEVTDRLSHDVDQALWALVGRAPEQALARLNPTHLETANDPRN